MLYTGKGDNGKTSLYHCDQRLSKNSLVAEALGSLDELNSFLGWCKVKASDLVLKLEQVQNKLFVIQAEVAGAEKFVSESDVEELETWIGEIEEGLDPIKSFVISGGSELSAMLDFARTIARRTERSVVAVKEAGLSGKVGVMIGGAPVTQGFCDSIGAQIYSTNASSAAIRSTGIPRPPP